MQCMGWEKVCTNQNAKKIRMNTVYVKDADNWITLCPECMAECKKYWGELWSETMDDLLSPNRKGIIMANNKIKPAAVVGNIIGNMEHHLEFIENGYDKSLRMLFRRAKNLTNKQLNQKIQDSRNEIKNMAMDYGIMTEFFRKHPILKWIMRGYSNRLHKKVLQFNKKNKQKEEVKTVDKKTD